MIRSEKATQAAEQSRELVTKNCVARVLAVFSYLSPVQKKTIPLQLDEEVTRRLDEPKANGWNPTAKVDAWAARSWRDSGRRVERRLLLNDRKLSPPFISQLREIDDAQRQGIELDPYDCFANGWVLKLHMVVRHIAIVATDTATEGKALRRFLPGAERTPPAPQLGAVVRSRAFWLNLTAAAPKCGLQPPPATATSLGSHPRSILQTRQPHS